MSVCKQTPRRNVQLVNRPSENTALILIMAFSLIPILSILKIMESTSFATYVLSTKVACALLRVCASVKNMLSYCDGLATKYLKLSCEIV